MCFRFIMYSTNVLSQIKYNHPIVSFIFFIIIFFYFYFKIWVFSLRSLRFEFFRFPRAKRLSWLFGLCTCSADLGMRHPRVVLMYFKTNNRLFTIYIEEYWVFIVCHGKLYDFLLIFFGEYYYCYFFMNTVCPLRFNL